MRRSTIDGWTYVFAVGALGNLANGFWMLADAPGWYRGLPAAVPDFGPLNEHFVRDIGSVFVTFGVGLLWAAFVPVVRVPALALVTLFYAIHALVHVYDTARGLVGPAHWTIDLPGTYLPAVVLVVLVGILARRRPVSR